VVICFLWTGILAADGPRPVHSLEVGPQAGPQEEPVAETADGSGTVAGAAAEDGEDSEPEAGKANKKEKEKKDGEWVVAPIPISNPTIGTGLGVVALYVRPLHKKDKVSPPSSFGAGGMYTDSESWAAGGIVKLRFKEARDRVDVGFGGFEFNYDFFGVGNEAGDRGIGIPISQRGGLVKVEYLTRIIEGLYIGPRYRILDTTTGLDFSQIIPPQPGSLLALELDVTTAYLGLHLRYDTRNYEYNPGKGRLADFGANFFTEAFGSDFTFQGYDASYNQYLSLNEEERRIIAVRGTACDVRGDAPFFELCALGMQDAFRGYPGGRYRDSTSLTAQAEYRWRFYKRWGMVVFGGLGQVAPSLFDFTSNRLIPSIGLGARFLVATENRINVRVDYAWGEDSQALYISVGEAF
jgi:hypothetical protein